MRLTITILVLFSICTFIFCGCTTETGGNSIEDSSQTVSVTETSNSAEESAVSQMPKPENGNMVIGKIESVAGNQITIDVAEIDGDFEMPEMNFEDFSRPERMSMPEGMEPPEGFSKSSGDFEFNGEMPEGFSMPDFENGEKPQRGQMPQFNMENIEITYTGEKEKYIIPKGVKVGSGDYTSLSKGMVVGLRLDESGTVTSVMIISQ